MPSLSLLPAKPDGASIRAAFLADERAIAVRLADEATVNGSKVIVTGNPRR